MARKNLDDLHSLPMGTGHGIASGMVRAPDPEAPPPPDPFTLSWAELRAAFDWHSDAGRTLLAIVPRDRPYAMVTSDELMRIETLIVELRRRTGFSRTRLPSVPAAFIGHADLAQLLAPHRYALCASDPAMLAPRPT